MCHIARKLLSEKLIDDFYEDHVGNGDQEALNKGTLAERCKDLLPPDQIFRLEAEFAENCSQELREFASFVAALLTTVSCHEDDEGGL